MGTTDDRDAGALVRRMIAEAPPRSRSLIVSVYGDAILPHGGEISLGGLMRLVAPFGLGERVVRTAVFRLVQDGILTSDRRGRRSFYRLTDTGRRHFESAQRRIYAWGDRDWAGDWLIVLAGQDIDPATRGALRRELGWQGFAESASGLFLHPRGEAEGVRATLAGLGLDDRAILFQARALPGPGEAAPALGGLVRQAWDLDGIEARYRAFLDAFTPLDAWLAQGRTPDPDAAFQARVLLIHEYRRTLLKDPFLPQALLPAGWSGTRATELAARIYARLAMPAERHLSAVAAAEATDLGALSPGFTARFGGLDRARAAE